MEKRYKFRLKWLAAWILSQAAYGAPPVTLQVASTSHQQTEYLILLFTNEHGWHTYAQDPGEVGLPFQFSFRHNNQPTAMAVTGWPNSEVFTDPTGLTSHVYTGQYAFFFFLPPSTDAMKEGESIHLDIKWLACKDRCVPQKAALDVLWKQGKWAPAEKDREAVVNPEQLVRLFSAQESGGMELVGEISAKKKLPNAFFWMGLLAIGSLGGLWGWRRFCASSKQ